MFSVISLALVLQLHNLAGAPQPVIDNAASELTRRYDELGVRVEWNRATAAFFADDDAIHVVLLANETGGLGRSADTVMGAAVRTPNGTRVVYVFYSQVVAESERHGVSTALLLTGALAHELGHLLMPGAGHSEDGLMRACWSAEDFHRADQGRLRYSTEQAAAIRQTLQRSAFGAQP
jgi:hypothetical protein